MTRIEDAVQKLQRLGRRPELARQGGGGGPQKQKVKVEGPRHKVFRERLVGAGLLVANERAVPVADEFRRIKRPLLANIANADAESGSSCLNVIMITSPLPGAGKTFCALNLAMSLSLEREANVLLVDADVVKPNISREFGLEQAPGLIDLLVDDSRDLSDVLVRTDLNDIQLLPAGRSHPHAAELVASERMSRIVAEVARRYADRIVVVDSPPLLVTSEAQMLADQVGQIVLLVEYGKTSREALEQAVEMLDPSKAVNLLLNKSADGGRAKYYGSDYPYDYESA